MGYDSRLYVIRKTNVPVGKGDKFKYAETLAVYEMGNFLPFQMLFNDGKSGVTEYYPCGENDYIAEDKYGDPLQERSLDEVIECLDKITVLNDDIAHYARIKPLLALLNGFKEIQNNWYRLAVLHYGH
jgi:hypothetical protein